MPLHHGKAGAEGEPSGVSRQPAIPRRKPTDIWQDHSEVVAAVLENEQGRVNQQL
jgi:hypothetical protein